MAGPWEKYQPSTEPATAEGPWSKYGAVEPSGSTERVRATDFGKELVGGALTGTGSVVSGAGDLLTTAGRAIERGARAVLPDSVVDAVRDLPAPSDILRPAGQQVAGAGERVSDSKSEAGKRALAESTPTGDITDPSSWSLGDDPSLAGYGLQMSNLVGQFVPQAGALLLPGGQGRLAGMAGIGGMQAGGAAGNEVEDRLAGMSDDDLQASSELYREMRGQGMAEPEARQRLQAEARAGAFQGAAPIGALGGALTHAALGPIQRAIGGSAGRRLAGGLVIDAPAEGLQEVAETVASRASTNAAIGEQQDLTEDTFGDALLGAIGGAGHASLGAAIGSRESARAADPQPEATFENTPEPVALPAPERDALPAPEPVMYADADGQVQDVGPNRNVDGVVQPSPQERQWVNPANDPDRMPGGPGMDQQTARGEPAPLIGQHISGPGRQADAPAAREPELLDGELQRAALPAPDTMVVDSQGNAQRGPVAPVVTERTPQGGRGMDQQAPTAQPDQGDYDVRLRKSGKPFAARGDARLSRLFSEAKKAGESPKVVRHGDGWAVGVPKAPQRLEMRPIDVAAQQAATSPTNDLPAPTAAQIEAGNYKKGRIRVQGLELSIENPKGSERSGTGPDGVEWLHTMSDHYGYIRRTTGADGEQVDAYVGPADDAPQVFVVDQVNQQDGSFDEHKVMIGYPDQAAAVAAYRSNFDADWQVGQVTAMPVADFKAWLKSGDLAKPLAQPQQIPQRAQQQQARDRRAVNRDRDSVVQATIKLGGITTEWRQDTTGDARGNKNLPGIGALWSDNTGTSLDDMASLLDQSGYVPAGEMERDGGVSWLQSALRDELGGLRTHYAPGSMRAEEILLQAEADRYAEDADREYARREEEYARIEAEYGAEIAAQARAYDEAARAHDEQALADIQQLESRYEQQQQDYADVDAALDGEPLTEAGAAARDEQLRQADEREGRSARATARPSPEPAGQPGSFELEQQTERSLSEQAARQQAAAESEAQAQRQADQRAQADRDRDDFNLTGSDRTSDVAASRGQNDMFSFTPEPDSNPDDQLYRAGEGAPGGVPAADVTAALSGIAELNGVTVVQSFDDLPLSNRTRAKRDGVAAADVRGIYAQGKTFIVADNHESVADAVRTALHEEVGHRGIRGLLGAELDPVMERIYSSEMLREKGRIRIAQIREFYAAPLAGMDAKQQRLLIAQEIIAHLSESGDRAKPLQRVASRIREVLRKLFPQVPWTYTDILRLIDRSRDWLRTQHGEQQGDDATLYSLRTSTRRPHVSDAHPDLNKAEQEALRKIAPPTPRQRAMQWYRERTDRIQTKIRQGLVDRYAALKELDEAAHGTDFLETSITNSAWALARMAPAAAGALHVMMHDGRLVLDQQQKVISMRDDGSMGLGEVLGRLGSAQEIERFFGWIAGNRASRLAAEGRENLFSAADIAALKGINRGTTTDGRTRAKLYDEVFKEFQQYRDDVLAIAEQTGIISPENRAMWRDEFYVPFYRVMDEDASPKGPRAAKGLSRQEAYKKLKGGKQNLNDLLENTLMNFNHLLTASLKNQAAAQAIANARKLQIAKPVKEAARDPKTSTYVLEGGERQWYQVDDPLVYEALTSLADPGLNNLAVKTMASFKRVFTNMTTITLQFITANFLRDSMQAAATSPVSKNVPANMFQGVKAYRNQKTRAQMLASGGAFNFGHIYGADPEEVKAGLRRSLRGAQLIDGPKAVPKLLMAGWDAYNGLANTLENANRAAIYKQNQGQGALRAAFEARDLMDFSQEGSWPAVRFLIRVVPFLNARLQGLDKLYRSGVKPSIKVAFGKGTDSDKVAAARFGTVTGALALASLALFLSNYDDEEYRKLEDWERDTYWWFRIGGHAIKIPKPFEVGAIATLAERTLEQFVDDKATGKLFRERLWSMVTQTFAFSPVPQAFQPVLDVYSNKDAFTGRPIENAGMERLSPELRDRATSTAPARAISSATAMLGENAALSPVQVDHLIGGYLGQVGAWGAGVVDTIWRTANGESEPAKRWSEYQPIRRFYRDLGAPAPYDRYSTLFYEGLKESGRVYADVKRLQELGRMDEARELVTEKRGELSLRKALNSTQRELSSINNRMDTVRRGDWDGERKRVELDRLQLIKSRLTEVAGKQVEAVKARQ